MIASTQVGRDRCKDIRPSVRLRCLGASAVWIVLLGVAGTVHADVNALRNDFLSPPRAAAPYRSMTLRGGDIDDSAARKQLESLSETGYGGVLLWSNAPLGGPVSAEEWARINEYSEPSYFKHLATLLQGARSIDMPILSTLTSCWPMGGGFAITPELAQVEVTVSHTQVQGANNVPIKLLLPRQPLRTGTLMKAMRPTPPGQELPKGWAERLNARDKIIAVIAVKGTQPLVLPTTDAILSPPDSHGVVQKSGQLDPATTVVLTNRMKPDGRLDWRAPEGTWQIFVFRQVPSDLVLTCGAGRGPQLVMDHLKKASFEAHKHRVFEAGRTQLAPFLGNTLTAYSVDSLETASDIYWTDALLTEFKRRRGYDLTSYLPFVFQPGWMMHPYQARHSAPQFDAPGVGERIRADYRLTISEMMIENLYEPFAAWAKQNKLHAEFQAQGAPVDILKAYGTGDVPETEDLHVGANPYFLKLARSAADIYGRSIVSAEALIWDRGGPSLTPQDLKHRADELLVAGINRIRIDGFDPGPNMNLLPPEVAQLGAWLTSRNPAWTEFERPFVKYIHRTQAILQQGSNAVPLAIFRKELAYAPSSATQEPKIEPESGFIAQLPSAGYDFDAINADVLQRSEVRDRELITPAGARFKALLFPSVFSLRIEVAVAVEKFAKAGLPILFVDGIPVRYEGFFDHNRRDSIVNSSISAARAAGARVISELEVVATLRSLNVAANVNFLGGTSAPFLEKRIKSSRVFFFRNPDNEPRRLAFEVPGRHGAQRWDTWNGTIRPQSLTLTGSGERVDLMLAPSESLFIVFDEALPKISASSSPLTADTLLARPVRVQRIGEKGWHFSATGVGAQARKVELTQALPALADLTTLEATRDFSGTALYKTTFDADPSLLNRDTRLLVDLGSLHDGATLKVNGQPFLLSPYPPYVADVTSAIHTGANELEVMIYNTINNAVAAGGAGLNGIRPAGLLGPVWLLSRLGTEQD